MKATPSPLQNSGLLTAIRQWFDVNPLVNLIQLIVGICILFFLPSYYFSSTEVAAWHFGALLLLMVAIGGLAHWMGNRFGEEIDLKMTLVWIGVTLAMVETITILSRGRFTRLLYMLLPIIAVSYLPRRLSLGIAVATIGWVIVSVILFGNALERSPYQNFFLLTIVYLAGYALGYALLQERRASQESRRLLHELRESNDQLTRYAAEATQLATVRERNRIAREIHDSLGHYLTVVGVQLEKAITFDAVNRVEATEAIKAAKQLNDQALAEVRQSVGALREMDETFTLHGALNALAQNVQQGGLTVDFRWRGDEDGLSEQQLLTLFRAAQEGLTNVQKHAQAQRVLIDMALDAETAVLRLTDDGVGIDAARLKNGGYGLQGLRERVALVQRTMTLNPISSGGTQLMVNLPRERIL